MIKSILIFSLILCQDDSTLMVKITDRVEWYYVIPSSRKITKANFDSNGVLYVTPKQFTALRKVIVIKNGVDITNQVKFLRLSKYTASSGQEYEFINFFSPSEKLPTHQSGIEWDDPEVEHKLSLEEKKVREKLISHGKIKFR